MSMADFILVPAYFVAASLFAVEARAIAEIVGGIGMTGAGLIQTTVMTTPDLIDLIFTTFEFVSTQLICFLKALAHPWCFFLFGLDAIVKTIYLCTFGLSLFGLYSLLGVNLYWLETKIWDIIEDIDCFVFGLTKFHLFHYPDYIQESCYNCCRVTQAAIKRKGDAVMDDINEYAPQLLYPGIDLLTQGGTHLINPFG